MGFTFLIIIMNKNTGLVLLTLLVLSQSNIWDNVYSQAKASMPIVLDQALNVDFNIKQYNSKVNLDFNPNLQLVTLATYFDLLLVRMEVFKAELDLHGLVLTLKRQGAGCQRFKLAMFEKVQLGAANLNKQRLILVNLFFKFIGQSQRGGQSLNKFQLDPFLLGKNSSQFENFTSSFNSQVNKEVQETIKKELNPDIRQKIEQFEDFDIFDIKYQLFVYTDKTKGNPRYISYGEQNKSTNEVNIPFKLFSNVDRPMGCTDQIKTLSNEQLGKLIAKLFNSAADFTQYFK